jgi:hypothetical protein
MGTASTKKNVSEHRLELRRTISAVTIMHESELGGADKQLITWFLRTSFGPTLQVVFSPFARPLGGRLEPLDLIRDRVAGELLLFEGPLLCSRLLELAGSFDIPFLFIEWQPHRPAVTPIIESIRFVSADGDLYRVFGRKADVTSNNEQILW